MTARGEVIAPPLAGPVLQDFIDARLGTAMPWWWDDTARAKPLYDAYVKHAERAGLGPVSAIKRADETLLSHRDFSLVLQSQGFAYGQDNEGSYYRGITVPTREERLWAAAERAIAEPVHASLWRAVREEHMREVEHVEERRVFQSAGQWATGYTETVIEQVPCRHDLRTRPNITRVAEQVREYMAAHRDEVTRYFEEQFGLYARWRPGEEDPNIALRAAEQSGNASSIRERYARAVAAYNEWHEPEQAARGALREAEEEVAAAAHAKGMHPGISTFGQPGMRTFLAVHDPEGLARLQALHEAASRFVPSDGEALRRDVAAIRREAYEAGIDLT